MKIFGNLFFLTLIFHLIFCGHFLQIMDINVPIVSQVLHDIVNEFLLKERIKFNIKIIGKVSQFQLDIMSKFMSNTKEKFDYRFMFDQMTLTESIPIFKSNMCVVHNYIRK